MFGPEQQDLVSLFYLVSVVSCEVLTALPFPP